MPKEQREDLHIIIIDEIRNLSVIYENLEKLINKIDPSPQEDEKEKAVAGYPHLRAFLEGAPEEIVHIRDKCLTKIKHIEELLFN